MTNEVYIFDKHITLSTRNWIVARRLFHGLKKVKTRKQEITKNEKHVIFIMIRAWDKENNSNRPRQESNLWLSVHRSDALTTGLRETGSEFVHVLSSIWHASCILLAARISKGKEFPHGVSDSFHMIIHEIIYIIIQSYFRTIFWMGSLTPCGNSFPDQQCRKPNVTEVIN